MKVAVKIRIVVILLLIIFFGLLILFGSRNIYEGATSSIITILPQNPLTDKPTSTVSGTLPPRFVNTINTPKSGTSFGLNKNNTVPSDIDKYKFINVYYYFPDNQKPGFTSADLPIIYLSHNISDYNVYFCNSIPFCPTSPLGQPSHQRIYLETKTSTNPIKTPTKFWKEYAIQNTNATTFNKWISNQKWSGDATKTTLNDATYSEILVSSSNNINGKAASSYELPLTSALSTLLPLKYDKQLVKATDPTKQNKAMYFDAQYNPNNIKDATLSVDPSSDTNANNGVICLITYYFKW